MFHLFSSHKSSEKEYISDKQIRDYFRNIFGFSVKHVDFYRTALTHRSASQTSTFGSKRNNERFEFIGDAVLDMITADFLCRKYPTETEGTLTKMRSKLVNRNRLNDLALKLGLHNVTNSKVNSAAKNVYGNTFEAVVGAIFRDKGYKKTYNIIINNVFTRFLDIDSIFEENKDYKSALLIWAQRSKRKLEFLHETIHEDHQDLFKSYVKIDDETVSEGISTTIKMSEQRAAEIALSKLEEKSFDEEN